MNWNTICHIDDIIPGTGVCAKVNDAHVAIFRPLNNEQLFALSNIDPFAEASVMSRGLLGEKDGEFYVASPLLKQRFNLATGQCLDDDSVTLPCYQIRTLNGQVQIAG
ncbi:nitrite reductase small subunit NirD [Spongorhabdus nitratireducens]